MFSMSTRGSYKNIMGYLKRAKEEQVRALLIAYAEEGVAALASATPKDSGVTADSWGYEITVANGRTTISWTNSNVHKGFPIAVALQYGHGTGTGGYVAGIDYINPAIRPIMDEISNKVLKAVST